MTLDEFEDLLEDFREVGFKLIKLARAAKKVKDNELIIIRTLDYATTEKYIEAAKIVGGYKDSVEEVFGDEV